MTAPTAYPVLRSVIHGAVATCFVLFPLPVWSAGPLHIPGPGEGYQISPPSDSSQSAPAGYEGRTDTSTQTAVGNTPATNGKRYVSHFTLGNQIKTCPSGDGASEGTGLFSVSVDYTDAQANGTSTTHVQMLAKAKYKGQVGDDAYLKNPVMADIDYTYDQSGSMGQHGGPIATPAGSHVAQHITIPINVGTGLAPPDFGAFGGGDPAQAHYVDAFGAGTALAYWAGIYYSVAQMKWRSGECAQISFAPPSNTVNMTPGANQIVSADVKSKEGQSAQGKFDESQAFGGTVSPQSGAVPMKFNYTAPVQAVKNAGFETKATSRAGIAIGEWQSGVHGGWSGRISFELTNDAPEIHEQMRDYSGHGRYETALFFKNGVGTAMSRAEMKSKLELRQNALRGGARTIIKSDSADFDGSAEGNSQAAVEVSIDKNTGTYRIYISWDSKQIGQPIHSVSCHRETCTTRDGNMLWAGQERVTAIDGKLDDLTHLHGSRTDQSNGPRDYITGKQTHTVTWDVSWLAK